jgi:hypothetical protein
MPSFSSAENACTTPSSRSTLTTTLLPPPPATLGLASTADPALCCFVDDVFSSFDLLLLLVLEPFDLLVDAVDDDDLSGLSDDFSDFSDLWCFFSFFAVTSLIFHFTLTMQRKKKNEKKKKKNEKNEKKNRRMSVCLNASLMR